MTKLEILLAEYAESHQNNTNKWIHYICVPLIFVSIYGLLYAIPIPSKSMYLNCGTLVYILALIYWFRLSKKIGFVFLIIGFILAMSTTFYWVWYLKRLDYLLAKFAFIIFIFSWLGQFLGHKIEGKKPSFLKDLQFLLIGPIWLFYPNKK